MRWRSYLAGCVVLSVGCTAIAVMAHVGFGTQVLLGGGSQLGWGSWFARSRPNNKARYDKGDTS